MSGPGRRVVRWTAGGSSHVALDVSADYPGLEDGFRRVCVNLAEALATGDVEEPSGEVAMEDGQGQVLRREAITAGWDG